MGKAARENAKQRQAWLSSLNDDENIAREAAENLLRRFIIPSESTGMCYRMTFLLNLYLQEKGVASTPVVGWITDGRDDIAMSHAWLMVNGKKIDLTLGKMSHPSMLRGEIHILDNIVKPGAKYSYFMEKEQKHLDADNLISSEGTSNSLLRDKNAEHELMVKQAGDPKKLRQYLDSAPDKWTYKRLKAVVEGRDPKAA